MRIKRDNKKSYNVPIYINCRFSMTKTSDSESHSELNGLHVTLIHFILVIHQIDIYWLNLFHIVVATNGEEIFCAAR